MAARSSDNSLVSLRIFLAAQTPPDISDRELLERFLSQQDQTAFAALFHRHGAMVLSVCRRVLHNRHDAEDACQATFLILAQRAASIRKRRFLGQLAARRSCPRGPRPTRQDRPPSCSAPDRCG